MPNRAADHDTPQTGRSQQLADRIGTAYSSALDKASDVASGIEGNAIAAIAGGLALGAIAGAMIPRGERERALLDPHVGRLGDAARAALQAAREAGGEAMTASGFGNDALRAQASRLFDEAAKAAGAAGTAALEAARASAKER